MQGEIYLAKKFYPIFTKIILLTAVAIFLLTAFSSCSKDDGSNYIFKTAISENPQNLDPQLAVDSSSKAIIINNFEGLLRKNENGEIVNGCIDSYEISSDGLRYTFNLKKGIFWHHLGDEIYELKADDFLFTFERILNPEANFSPFTEDFTIIKNAGKILAGELELSELGVTVIDDYTLEIELERESYNFFELLTETAAMPCNREFFESTKGRYGLFAETTASNGPFYVKEWNFDPYWDDNYIIMKKNKDYISAPVSPSGINFFIGNDDFVADFSDGDYHCISSDKLEQTADEVGKTTAYSTKTYGFIFNENSDFYSNSNIKKAFASAFNRQIYSDKIMDDFETAYGIIPPEVSISGKKYSDLVSENSFDYYNSISASNIFYEELELLGISDDLECRILILDGEIPKENIEFIASQLNNTLGINCKIEIVSKNEYDLRVKEKNFDILFTKITAEKNSPLAFINSLLDIYEKLGFYQKYYQIYPLISQLNSTGKLSSAVDIFNQIENLLLSSGDFIPLFYGYDYFYTDKNAQDIHFSPFTNEVYFADSKIFS